MEKIKDREKLVEKVIEKFKADYIECTKNSYINKEIANVQFENPTEDTDFAIIYATLLLWVKKNIIDTNGAMFKTFWKRFGEEEAQFIVQTSDLEVIPKYDNFILNMYYRLIEEYDIYGINTIFILSSVEDRNFAHEFIGIIDKLLLEKGKVV